MVPHRLWTEALKPSSNITPGLLEITAAVETCWKVVDTAMDVSGGTGMFKGNELERLFRDARCGRFHPATSNLVHEIVAKTALGIELGEQPRWG